MRSIIPILAMVVAGDCLAATRLYTRTTAPATCTVGDLWTDTDGTAGEKFYICEATNTWVRQVGYGTTSNPSFNSVHASGGNLAAANKQVTKAWQSGLSYTADVTSVIHGGKHWIAKTTHTAGSTTEPGVGASYADAWTEVSGAGDDLGDATSSTIIALFGSGSCSGYLKSDGGCDTPSGAAHDAVTLGTDADVLLGLSTQQITLDSQTANYVFAAPNGVGGDPTFRALVAADIPTLSRSKISDLGTSAQYNVGTGANNIVQLNSSGELPFDIPGKANASCFASESAFNACFDLTWATGGVSVSDTAYGSGWNGVTNEAPSKNAVFDKIEALSLGGVTVQSADPTSSSAVGWYAATGSGDIFYKSSAGLFTIAGSYTADPVVPTLTSLVIGTNGTTLTLTGSASLSVGSGGNGGFDVDCSTAGNGITATYASGAPGTGLVYTLGTTVNSGDTCDLDYTQPGNGIEATTGGADLASITSAAITNNSTQGAGMTTATDTFDRANSGTLGSLSGGTYSWTQVVGDFDIESNQAHNIGSSPVAVLNPAVNQNAYTVQADVHCEGNAYSTPGVVFWYTDSSNYWRALFSQSASQMVIIQEVVAGTAYDRATGGGNGFSNTNLYNLKVVTSGTSVNVYFNGSGSPTVSHTAASAGSGNVGIYVARSTGTGYVDNFSAANN